MSSDNAPSSSRSAAAAPQLLFDDGSRVMQEQSAAAAQEIVESNQKVYAQTRGYSTLPLREYYEIDRLVREIQQLAAAAAAAAAGSTTSTTTSTCTWRNRIALQFPDELLVDSPDVCWELEEALIRANESEAARSVDDDDKDKQQSLFVDPPPLVFCLGDTTYQSCCPDLVAAAHLQADCLVHFGHACLSNNIQGRIQSCGTVAASCASPLNNQIPVLYSFGKAEINVETVADQVLSEIKKNNENQGEEEGEEDHYVHRILLLSEVRYMYVMKDLQERLESSSSNGTSVQVAVGRIPENRISSSSSLSSSSSQNNNKPAPSVCGAPSCCKNGNNVTAEEAEGVVCGAKEEANAVVVSPSSQSEESKTTMSGAPPQGTKLLTSKEHGFIVGGLELPKELIESWASSPFTLLFVGSDESRQYLNIVLRFLSSTNEASPTNYWTWNPTTQSLSTELSPRFKRQLNRRFYLVQKARLSNVFGLLVANLSDVYMRSVVHSLRSLIEQKQHEQQKACYTFVVGKINPAKISNFAEIDCFVMVACPEHSLLQVEEEREYPVPVITPLELSMALGVTEWGKVAYSLDTHDYLQQQQQQQHGNSTLESDQEEDDDDDSDAPYFNPVTGQYESSFKQQQQPDEDLDLAALPGHGTLTKYASAAADFFKQREYQGLQVDAGETEVQSAIPGQQGIASYYSER